MIIQKQNTHNKVDGAEGVKTSGSKTMDIVLPKFDTLQPTMEKIEYEKYSINLEANDASELSMKDAKNDFDKYKKENLYRTTSSKKISLIDEAGKKLDTKSNVNERDYFPIGYSLDKDYFIPNIPQQKNDVDYTSYVSKFKLLMNAKVATLRLNNGIGSFQDVKNALGNSLSSLAILSPVVDVMSNTDYDTNTLLENIEAELDIVRDKIKQTPTIENIIKGGDFWASNYNTPIAGYVEVPGKIGLEKYKPVFDNVVNITAFNCSFDDVDLTRAAAHLAIKGEVVSRDEVLERIRNVIYDFSAQYVPVATAKGGDYARSIGGITYARPFMISDVQKEGSAVEPHVQLEISNMVVSKDPLFGFPIYTWIEPGDIKKDMESRLVKMLSREFGFDIQDIVFEDANSQIEANIANKQRQAYNARQEYVADEYDKNNNEENMDNEINNEPVYIKKTGMQKARDAGLIINSGERHAEILKTLNNTDINAISRMLEVQTANIQREAAEAQAQADLLKKKFENQIKVVEDFNKIPEIIYNAKEFKALQEVFIKDEFLLTKSREIYSKIIESGIVAKEVIEQEKLRIIEELTAELPEAVEGEQAPQVDSRRVEAQVFGFVHAQFKAMAAEGHDILQQVEGLANSNILSAEEQEQFKNLATSQEKVNFFTTVLEQKLVDVRNAKSAIAIELSDIKGQMAELNDSLSTINPSDLGMSPEDWTAVLDDEKEISERVVLLTEIMADKHQEVQTVKAERDGIKAERDGLVDEKTHLEGQIDGIKRNLSVIVSEENRQKIQSAPRDDIGAVVKEIVMGEQERADNAMAQVDVMSEKLNVAAKHIGDMVGRDIPVDKIGFAVTTVKLRLDNQTKEIEARNRELAVTKNSFDTLAAKFEEIEPKAQSYDALKERFEKMEATLKGLGQALYREDMSAEDVLNEFTRVARETLKEQQEQQAETKPPLSQAQLEAMHSVGLIDDIEQYQSKKQTQEQKPDEPNLDDDEPTHNR